MRYLLPFLLALVCFRVVAAPERTCRILLFLNGPDNAPDTVHLFDGETSQEVELPRIDFSRIYELRPGALTLHLLPAAPGEQAGIPAGAPVVKPRAYLPTARICVPSHRDRR